MAVSELSLDEIHEFILCKGGRVSNRELVQHFKRYLTDPDTKSDSRIKFKEYVNILATSKTEGDEKYIVLRSKYVGNKKPHSSSYLPQSTPDIRPSNVLVDTNASSSPSKARQPPPYRPPPPPVSSSNPSLDNISLSSSIISLKDVEEPPPPQAPPRRKSQSKNTPSIEADDADKQSVGSETTEQVISVKERTQKFNRLASVDNDLSPQPQKEKRKVPDSGADEDDGASVTSLEPKRTEWIVAAARGDYQALAKLAAANPRLVKTKDPFTTALHWAAKHGDMDIVKLIAGKYNADVNARTNGGYTPLHIATLFGHKNLFELLVDVYGGQPDLRDWSGRMPIYYLRTQKPASKTENYLKLKVQKKSSEKDLGFLRIGSLNVRVKKTTEAFSNFLGVGSGGSITPSDNSVEKVHKSWGSADNVFKENEMMAPKIIPNSKRKLKQPQDHTSYSTPSTPNQKRSAPAQTLQDSDSDTACGFDSNWKH